MSEAATRPRLERRIGPAGATLLSFNGVVGGGIFALPAILAADFGSFSPWLFPIVAIGSLLIVIPVARVASAFPESGGPAIYGLVFGRFAGFQLGWFYYAGRTGALAANANVLTAYLARWWSGADEGLARAAVILGICAALAAVNIAGVKRALAVLGGLTFLKAMPLLIAAVAAILLAWPLPAPGPLPQLSGLEAGALLVFYAFVGFENAVVPAGETKRPSAVLPLAILATIASTALLYFLVQLAFVSAVPTGDSDDAAPLVALGSWLAGPAGAAVITATALASLAGNLHGNTVSSSRITYAMAVRGDLPRWFARVHPRFRTPANSILFLTALAAVLALSGTFVWLAVVSVLARLVVYAGTIAALPRAPVRGRIHPLMYAIGAAGIALCIWGAFQAEWTAWQGLGLLAVAGAVLYALAARGRASPSEAATVSAMTPPPSTREPS